MTVGMWGLGESRVALLYNSIINIIRTIARSYIIYSDRLQCPVHHQQRFQHRSPPDGPRYVMVAHIDTSSTDCCRVSVLTVCQLTAVVPADLLPPGSRRTCPKTAIRRQKIWLASFSCPVWYSDYWRRHWSRDRTSVFVEYVDDRTCEKLQAFVRQISEWSTFHIHTGQQTAPASCKLLTWLSACLGLSNL